MFILQVYDFFFSDLQISNIVSFRNISQNRVVLLVDLCVSLVGITMCNSLDLQNISVVY